MNTKFSALIACLLWLVSTMGNCGEAQFPKVTTIHLKDGSYHMKLCNIEDDKVTVLVVSIGSKGRETTLPKFSFEMPVPPQPPKVAALESRLTYVKLIENGPSVLKSGKWFIIQGERTLASGDIHFGEDVARKIMLGSQSLEQLTLLLQTKQANGGKAGHDAKN